MAMTIEVLLRRSIEGVGHVGDIVRVKPGYARNYLIPKAYAARVSADSLRRIEKDKAAEMVRETELSKKRSLLAESLSGLKLTIEERAGEDGHLYGSVGPRQIVAALLDAGHEFQERQIVFDTVRELGEYEAQLNLGGDVLVPLQIWVVQDAQDALEQKEAAERAATEGPAQQTDEYADLEY